MNSSQFGYLSAEKGELNMYGYNYLTTAQQGSLVQPPPHYTVPQTTTAVTGATYYNPVPVHQSHNNGASSTISQYPPFVTPSVVTDPISHQQSPYQYPFQPPFLPQRKRPWWMWTIGVADIAAALFFIAKVVYNVVTKGDQGLNQDRDILMWAIFIVLLSLGVQFLMGVGLLVGLKSDQDETIFWYCQTWICGAYFLFGISGLELLSVLHQLQTERETNGGFKLIFVLTKITFRVVAYILVTRFMRDLRQGKSQHRLSLMKMEQYQQQHQQLQDERQQQQYLQEQNGEAGWRSGTRGSDCYYYVPQMPMMMAMMMNQ